jgi:NO-binding membrane sensor protein with MHYT domain
MMGYDPGVIMGYSLVPTILSLLVAIAAVTGGFWLALRSFARQIPYQRLLAWRLSASGIAAMHYTGMQAVEMARHDSSGRYAYVAASIAASRSCRSCRHCRSRWPS